MSTTTPSMQTPAPAGNPNDKNDGPARYGRAMKLRDAALPVGAYDEVTTWVNVEEEAYALSVIEDVALLLGERKRGADFECTLASLMRDATRLAHSMLRANVERRTAEDNAMIHVLEAHDLVEPGAVEAAEQKGLAETIQTIGTADLDVVKRIIMAAREKHGGGPIGELLSEAEWNDIKDSEWKAPKSAVNRAPKSSVRGRVVGRIAPKSKRAPASRGRAAAGGAR